MVDLRFHFRMFWYFWFHFTESFSLISCETGSMVGDAAAAASADDGSGKCAQTLRGRITKVSKDRIIKI